MNNEGSNQNAQTRNFFETHGSGEIVTALDVTLDMREDGVKRFDLIRKKSPIFKQALSIKGLKAHNRSMRALTASTYYIRCKKCENIPLVTQVVVFHTKGMERFFEDGTHISAPFPFDGWQVKDGFHFLIEFRCTHCFEAHSTIATFKRPIALLIQEYVKWTNQHNQPKNESGSGFMVKPSWIKTYFVEKKIDLKYAQKTASACIKRYLDIKNARNKHQLSGMSFDKEVIEGILDVIRNLTPPIESETQFCGLIKGVYFFTLVYYQDKEYNFPHLDPTSNLPFSFNKLKQEFKVTARKLTYDEKKGLLASAILYVENVYKSLTLHPMTVPDWVSSFGEFVSSLFPNLK